ncbi:MAG: SHOCT domain-containing protein [Candidatus Cloacimonetes bacterium]|nr:SHOCT domain-containing protein [Candidatus Cloacimonadota bacterium]
MRLLMVLICLFCQMVCADSAASRLSELSKIYKQGLISKEEYDETKRQILRSLSKGNDKAQTSQTLPTPAESLIAVIPFFGKVYSDGDRDSVAKFTVENMRRYIESNQIDIDGGIQDFHLSKQLILGHLGIIDPDAAYTDDQLKTIAKILNVRYLAFGKINHLSFEHENHRFNVECKVYDAKLAKVVHESQARQSTARKFFTLLIPEKGKSIGKISEQFYGFLDRFKKQSPQNANQTGPR